MYAFYVCFTIKECKIGFSNDIEFDPADQYVC